jgi:uncharacterized protein (DUF983 family)
MSGKSCPRCGNRITLRQYLRTTSLRFECCQCGAYLSSDMRRTFLAPLISALPLGLAISQAIDHPVWWLGVVAVLGLSLFLSYWMFRIELHHGSEVPGSQV